MLSKLRANLIYLATMLVMGFAIYYFALNPNSPLKKPAAPNVSAAAFFNSKLVNEDGLSQDLMQYQGKVIVLNFWATWCPPCREEMPELSELHTQYQTNNVVVIGLAVDELSLVKEFAEASPVSYPLLVGEDEGMQLASDFGNNQGVLPYTVIIGQDGKVLKTYFGRISKALLSDALKPILQD
ncbi:MAG: TlpA family protein disulfide reductase [Methylotenera sp.]|nr:TlpA family protein disulfide reductase [Methylotenera sp.]